jgi:hypothetical protein
MPTAPTTTDGRCWSCNQRAVAWGVDATWSRPVDGVRHIIDRRVRLCAQPRRGASRAPETRKDRQREYYARWKAKGGRVDPIAAKRKRLKHFYGLAPERFDAMFKKQRGLCAICKEEPATQVDHDHGCCPGARSCGKCIRGLLCGSCNRMLGQAKEDPARLRAGLRYLARFT